MVHVAHVEINGTDVIVVNSVFNEFHIVVSHGETSLSKVVNKLLLGVLSSIFNTLIDTINDFTEVLFSFLRVDL